MSETSADRNCPNCGREVKVDATTCGYCWKKLPIAKAINSTSSVSMDAPSVQGVSVAQLGAASSGHSRAGKVELGHVMTSALSDQREAVQSLFSGFLSTDEVIAGCGYLGSLGFLFRERSFWCVTNRRACSMRIKVGGEFFFQSAHLEHINSDAFYQPSVVFLWALIILVTIATFGVGILLAPLLVDAFYRIKKSGIAFWVREGLPVYIFADRRSLRKAQGISVMITEMREARLRDLKISI